MNIEGIWITPTGEKSEIVFKNGLYYARHLEANMEWIRKDKKDLIKYIKHYNMEKLK